MLGVSTFYLFHSEAREGVGRGLEFFVSGGRKGKSGVLFPSGSVKLLHKNIGEKEGEVVKYKGGIERNRLWGRGLLIGLFFYVAMVGSPGDLV